MYNKIGFIGAGKMASAIMGGILNSGFKDKNSVFAQEVNPENAILAEEILKIKVVDNVVSLCDVIVLATKPFVAKEVLNSIKDKITNDKLLISICAGISTKTIEEILGENPRVIRVMPNTPALINKGMTGICRGKNASDEDFKFAFDLFETCGKSVEIDESKIDALTAVSGSGPAFYYYIIDEIARSAMKLGLDYETALLLSAQTAYGSAKMILNGGATPETLIKNVTTPGGCTAEGNEVLKNSDFSEIAFEMLEKTAKKSAKLGN